MPHTISMDNYWAAARSKSEVDKMVIDQGSGAYLVRLVKVRMPLCITFFNLKKQKHCASLSVS